MTFDETFDRIFDPNKPKRAARPKQPLSQRLRLPRITAAPHQEVLLEWDTDKAREELSGVSFLRITINQLLPDANDAKAHDAYLLSATSTAASEPIFFDDRRGQALMKIVFNRQSVLNDEMPDHLAREEILRNVYDALKFLAEHEVHEWMRVDGERFREPHRDSRKIVR